MIPGPFADFVGTNNGHAVRTILDHAQQAGARRFLFVGYEGVAWSSFAERRLAFERLCAERGLRASCVAVPWRDEAARVLARQGADLLPELRTDIAMPVLQQNAMAWFRDGRELAVVAVNDYVALQVKLVRPSLRVYGIDGLAQAVENGIATYRHPMGAMGRLALKMIMEQQTLGRTWHARRRTLKGELIVPPKKRKATL